MRAAVLVFLLILATSTTVSAQATPASSQERISSAEKEIERLRSELEALREKIDGPPPVEDSVSFKEQVLAPGLGERNNVLKARPEIFVQVRFARRLVPQADPSDTDQPNSSSGRDWKHAREDRRC